MPYNFVIFRKHIPQDVINEKIEDKKDEMDDYLNQLLKPCNEEPAEEDESKPNMFCIAIQPFFDMNQGLSTSFSNNIFDNPKYVHIGP